MLDPNHDPAETRQPKKGEAMQAGTAGTTRAVDIHEVIAAVAAGDHEGASAQAREALERGAMHPLFLNLRAWWHERNGRLPAALADLEHAHALAPDDVPVLNALGLCLERLGRTRDAYNAFDKAAKVAPDFVPAQLNRGRTAESLGDFNTARSCYERALQLGHNAHPELASLAARRADWPEARLHAQHALAINAGLFSAEHILAAAEIAAGDTATAIGRLIRLLKGGTLTPFDRATTLSLLGDAHDRQGEYAAAFAAYDAGNAAKREAVASRLSGADSLNVHLERLARYFGPLPRQQFVDAREDCPGNEDGAAHHVFLLGFARSGTTLVEEILACHPDVTTTQEKDALVEAVANLFTNDAGFDRLMALSGGGLARYRRSYWRALESFGIHAKERCLVDKQPYNTLRLPLLAKLFPRAKIVFCMRDPRDVVLSCFRRRFLINDSNLQLLTLEGAAMFYDRTMRLAETYREKIPLDITDLRNEDLVADFDGETQRLCSAIGISWNDEMRSFANNATRRSVVTPSAEQLAGGLSGSGVGHWRNYRRELEPVLPILAPWVERFGYPAE